MTRRPILARLLPLLLGAFLVAGCGPQTDPAEQKARSMIDEIDTAITSAGPDAVKYLPGKVAAAKGQVSQLKIMYYDKDFKGIAENAPGVLERAKNLAPAAAAKKAEIAAELEKDWTELVTGAPAAIAAAEKQADELAKAAKLPPGVDEQLFKSAKDGIAELKKLWEKALAAKAAGDIEQAVTAGLHTQRRAENLLRALEGNQD